jgi:CubicO group peptidase (beta-lactamase class C family)
LLEPDGEFRDQDHYSGVMVTVAGLMLEQASGTTWSELIEGRLLEPLGMARTTIGPPDTGSGDLALPHLRIDGETVAGEIIFSAPDIMQSGIYSTANDMARWLQFLLGGGRFGETQLVSPQSLAETWTPQMALRRRFNPGRPGVRAYGLGWEVGTLRDQRYLSHAGGGAGATSYLALLPDLSVGAAVLTNSALNPVPDLAANWIFNRVFGVDEPDPREGALRMVARMESMQRTAREQALSARNPDEPAPLALEAYAGTYTDFVYGSVEIGAEAEHLTCRFHGVELAVDHLHDNVFLISSPLFDNLTSEFKIAPDGSVASVAVPIGHNGAMIVFERPPIQQQDD